MTLKDKQELVRLLGIYCDDLLTENENNIRRVKAAEKAGKHKWEIGVSLKSGVKAQFHHARIIMTKLLAEIGREVKSSFEL